MPDPMPDPTPKPAAGAAPRSVSVLLPVLNGEAYLERVVEGLARQRTDRAWEFVVVDSGSTDRTLAILADAAERLPVPVRVHGQHKSEFDHGDTRNLLAALATGDLLLFVTDDAIPVGEDWLETLAATFDEDPRVAGAYLRNTPRPEADVLARSLSDRDGGYQPGAEVRELPDPDTLDALTPEQRRALYNYNDTASCLRRDWWERCPYPRVDFGEDVLLARTLLHAGARIAYVDAAVIHHSHEYDAPTTRARSVPDARFNVEWLDRPGVRSAEDLEQEVAVQLAHDRAFLEAEGLAGAELEHELARAEELRRAYFEGQLEGAVSPRRFPPLAALEESHPKVAAAGLPRGLRRGLEERGWTLGSDPELAEVYHVHGDDEDALGLVEEEVRGGRPVLWTVSQAFAERHGLRRAVLEASDLLDPARAATNPLAEVLAEHGTDGTDVPLQVCVWRTDDELEALRGAGRGVALDPDAERVRVLEFRYRALVVRARSPRPAVVLDVPAARAVEAAGGARALEAGRLLLPPDASARWALTPACGGARELLLFLQALRTEAEVLIGGSLSFVDAAGRELGEPRELPLWRPAPRVAGDPAAPDPAAPRVPDGEEARLLRLDLDVPEAARGLVLRARRANGDPTTLRLSRLVLLDPTRPPGACARWIGRVDLRGSDARLTGRAEVQDVDMALLGRTPGRATWTARGARPGPHDLELELSFTAEEATLEQKGRVWVDGVPVARFGPVTSPPGGGAVRLRLPVDLPRPDAEVALTNTTRPLKRKAFARARRLVLTPWPAAEAARAALPSAPAGTILRPGPLARWLRVPPHVTPGERAFPDPVSVSPPHPVPPDRAHGA